MRSYLNRVVSSWRAWGAQVAKKDEFPLAKPFFVGMVASGVGVYYVGRWYASKSHENYKKRVADYVENAEGNRAKVSSGERTAEDCEQVELSSQHDPFDIVTRNPWTAPTLGVIVVTSIGTMLYRNWNRKSIAMSLMHTRITAQALVLLGVIGMIANAKIQDGKRKQESMITSGNNA